MSDWAFWVQTNPRQIEFNQMRLLSEKEKHKYPGEI